MQDIQHITTSYKNRLYSLLEQDVLWNVFQGRPTVSYCISRLVSLFDMFAVVAPLYSQYKKPKSSHKIALAIQKYCKYCNVYTVGNPSV